jgi:cobalamin biosynthesis protein CobD/CbiB
MMKNKILVVGLLLTSLIGYLEWGKDHRMFLFQVEWDIISKLISNPSSVIHPLVLLPLAGQLLLAIALFQQQPKKLLLLVGMACIGILLAFMLLVGLLSMNIKIILSTFPFLIMVVVTILHNRKKK